MNPYFHGRGIFQYDPKLHAETKIAPSDFTVGAIASRRRAGIEGIEEGIERKPHGDTEPRARAARDGVIAPRFSLRLVAGSVPRARDGVTGDETSVGARDGVTGETAAMRAGVTPGLVVGETASCTCVGPNAPRSAR